LNYYDDEYDFDCFYTYKYELPSITEDVCTHGPKYAEDPARMRICKDYSGKSSDACDFGLDCYGVKEAKTTGCEAFSEEDTKDQEKYGANTRHFTGDKAVDADMCNEHCQALKILGRECVEFVFRIKDG
jgi:hypothetical protein